MSLEQLLPQNKFWSFFLKICSIPHPSGHEEQLRDYLQLEAEKHHLPCRIDSAGNIAIDRPAAPGYENRPLIILQAHMDMVPQTAEGVEFDFLRDPIPVATDGDWVHTNCQTTLGADDGMGLALAMELLTDPDLKCGALRGLFTVAEEIGLIGAGGVDRSFLNGNILCNLDSETIFTVGCAGGARFSGKAVLETADPDDGLTGISINIGGMHGGHSGSEINRNYGSAARELGKLLELLKDIVRIASVETGTLDNVIASSGTVTAAVRPEDIAHIRECLEQSAKKLNAEFIPADGAVIFLEMTEIPLPAKVLTSAAQKNLLTLLNTLPHGLLAAMPNGDSESSCNLASVRGQAGGVWRIVELARSLYDRKRMSIADNAVHLMQRCGFDAKIESSYTSWPPRYDSPFLERACGIYKQVTGKTAVKSVTHGGLETGFFSGMNPDLEMISFAPRAEFIHSVQERLSISSVEEIRQLLRRLITD